MQRPAGGGLLGRTAMAQTRAELLNGRTGNSVSDPRTEDKGAASILTR
jgi:hypothetical protein